MNQAFPKGVEAELSHHFKSTDFDCQCKYSECVETLINPLLIECLEALWVRTGPFLIDSGFRCARHNQEVGGSPKSQHLFGNAADCMSSKGYNGNFMARAADQIIPFSNGGIGIYPGFVHVDVRRTKARWAEPFRC